MKVEIHKVVGIEYTLKNVSGEVVDSNAGEDLLHFIWKYKLVFYGLAISKSL